MQLEVIRRNGDRHVVLYDDADHALVSSHKWHVRSLSYERTFYAATAIKKPQGGYRNVFMHNLLTGLKDIDHINHNGLDNRRSNLRVATRSQQGGNRQRNRNTASRFKGVHLSKRDNKWIAYIRMNGKRSELGRFDSDVEAAHAYDRAAISAWGDFAYTNFDEAQGGQ